MNTLRKKIPPPPILPHVCVRQTMFKPVLLLFLLFNLVVLTLGKVGVEYVTSNTCSWLTPSQTPPRQPVARRSSVTRTLPFMVPLRWNTAMPPLLSPGSASPIHRVGLRPVHMPRVHRLRISESRSLGASLWAQELRPSKSRIYLSRTLWNPDS